MKSKVYMVVGLMVVAAVTAWAGGLVLGERIEKKEGVEYSFDTVDGKYYNIQTSTDNKNWIASECSMKGNGSRITMFYAPSVPRKFYRAVETDDPEVVVVTSPGFPKEDFDSGWIQISTGQDITVTHDLGFLPRNTIMWASRNEDKSDMFHMDAKTVRGFGEVGCNLEHFTENSFQIIAGGHSADPRTLAGTIWVRIYLWK